MEVLYQLSYGPIGREQPTVGATGLSHCSRRVLIESLSVTHLVDL